MKLRIANKILNHPYCEDVYSSAQIRKAEIYVEKLAHNHCRECYSELSKAMIESETCNCGCVDGHDCICYYDYEYGTCDGL